MPPKKKPSRNGYWQFMLEVRDKNPNKHRNKEELESYATQKWSAMSKEERQPYEHMAALARDTFRTVKYTSDGLDIDVVEKQEQDAKNQIQGMKNDIDAKVKAASTEMVLGNQVFLIIHVNHLIYYPAEDKYFICEIAIAAMSLQNGVEEVFHRLVKHGKLPLGFYGGALNHSKETHQLIEVVQDEPYENNTEEVFEEMIQFMRRYKINDKLPILYSLEKTWEMISKVIGNFRFEFNFPSEIKVHNLQYLFYALRNGAAGKKIWTTETFSYSELEKDVYCYSGNLSCDFHEAADLSVYCSKSIVTRYAFTICDHCCVDLGIQLVPGVHVPAKSRVVTETRSASAAQSVRSEDSCRPERPSSVSSASGYDVNFPPLGGSNTTPSVASFSSMKSNEKKPRVKAAFRLEQSFKNVVSLNEAKRDHSSLQFPPRGRQD